MKLKHVAMAVLFVVMFVSPVLADQTYTYQMVVNNQAWWLTWYNDGVSPYDLHVVNTSNSVAVYFTNTDINSDPSGNGDYNDTVEEWYFWSIIPPGGTLDLHNATDNFSAACKRGQFARIGVVITLHNSHPVK